MKLLCLNTHIKVLNEGYENVTNDAKLKRKNTYIHSKKKSKNMNLIILFIEIEHKYNNLLYLMPSLSKAIFVNLRIKGVKLNIFFIIKKERIILISLEETKEGK